MHVIEVIVEELSVENAIDRVTRADDTDDCKVFASFLLTVLFLVVVLDLGLLEYLVGQYLASSSQAKAIFSRKW